jgi:hypothetical protein
LKKLSTCHWLCKILVQFFLLFSSATSRKEIRGSFGRFTTSTLVVRESILNLCGARELHRGRALPSNASSTSARELCHGSALTACASSNAQQPKDPWPGATPASDRASLSPSPSPSFSPLALQRVMVEVHDGHQGQHGMGAPTPAASNRLPQHTEPPARSGRTLEKVWKREEIDRWGLMTSGTR